MSHSINRLQKILAKSSRGSREIGWDEPYAGQWSRGDRSWDGNWEEESMPASRSTKTAVQRTTLGRVRHWLFIQGGMAPIVLGGLMLFPVIAWALGFR